jgi:iron complex outermembrane receptor protein
MEQRRNMDITTSVSSDIFGDVTDGNVGEFLKYLPGVDLDYVESEARGPRLGGMDAQYVGVSFDGSAPPAPMPTAAAMPPAPPASRASPSPPSNRSRSAAPPRPSPTPTPRRHDQHEDQARLRPQGPPRAFNASLNFNAEEFTLKKTPGPRDGDILQVETQRVQVDYSESFLNQRSASCSAPATPFLHRAVPGFQHPQPGVVATDPRPYVIRQIDFKDGNKNILKDAFTAHRRLPATPQLVLSLNAIYTYTEGEFWNRNFTWVAANDNANVNNGRARVGGDGLTTVVATRAPSGSINNVATLNNGGGSSTKLTYTRTITQVRIQDRGLVVDGSFGYSRSVNNYESLERGWSNSEGGGVPSSWTATRPQPESWEWTIRQTSGNDWFNRASFVDTNTRSGGTRVNNDDRTWITRLSPARSTPAGPCRSWNVFRPCSASAASGRRKPRQQQHVRLEHLVLHRARRQHGRPNALGANVNTAFGNWANLGRSSSPPPLRHGHDQRPHRLQCRRPAGHAAPRRRERIAAVVPRPPRPVRAHGQSG